MIEEQRLLDRPARQRVELDRALSRQREQASATRGAQDRAALDERTAALAQARADLHAAQGQAAAAAAAQAQAAQAGGQPQPAAGATAGARAELLVAP